MGDDDQLRAPIGTRDVLPPESARWTELIGRFARHAGDAGYGLVQSPMFATGVGLVLFGVSQRRSHRGTRFRIRDGSIFGRVKQRMRDWFYHEFD